MGWPLAISLGSAALQLFGGLKAASSAKKGGQAAYEAAYANAQDILSLGLKNASALTSTASFNAGSVLRVGEANAQAIERAALRNMYLYGLQAGEERRRHIIQEKTTAGSIRAMAGASGVQTNTGTPLHYLNAQIDLGIRERRYGDLKAFWTLKNMQEEGEERAYITRLTASEQASVIEYNAAMQSEIMLAESQARAAASERQGQVALETGNAQSTSAMFGAIGGAFGTFANTFNALGGQWGWNSGGGGQTYNYSGSAWQNQSSLGGSLYGTGMSNPATSQTVNPYGQWFTN
mgnify:CR=1 FL=1